MLFGIFVMFIVSWWLALFMLLPVGATPDAHPEQGHASSSPASPRIKLKMLVATLLAAVITAAFFTAMQHGLFDFLDIRGA